jgi:hypothetical protein
VDTREALAVLGIGPQASPEETRAAYVRLIRDRHPDRAGDDPDATRQTARLTEAYAVLARGGARPARTETPPPRAGPTIAEPTIAEPLEVSAVTDDTIAIAAPPDEAFAALFEAAGRVGHVAYFDRQLGILESVVRFEGGPSCSVLMTLQGRGAVTEAFCHMESIEAAPTPPIAPVVEALVDELTR